MGEHKGVYANRIRWHLDGTEDGNTEALQHAAAYWALCWLNDSGLLGELVVTHYRDRPLSGKPPSG